MKAIKILGLLLLTCSTALAQEYDSEKKAIDTLIAEFYEALTYTDSDGSDNAKLDALHYPDAMVGVVDTSRVRIFKELDFRKRSEEGLAKNNVVLFKEKELGSITHIYGGVAMRFSPYEFIIKSPSRELVVQGVNTIQLVKDPEKGWLVYSVFFSDNLSYPDVPKEYLKN